MAEHCSDNMATMRPSTGCRQGWDLADEDLVVGGRPNYVGRNTGAQFDSRFTTPTGNFHGFPVDIRDTRAFGRKPSGECRHVCGDAVINTQNPGEKMRCSEGSRPHGENSAYTPTQTLQKKPRFSGETCQNGEDMHAAAT